MAIPFIPADARVRARVDLTDADPPIPHGTPGYFHHHGNGPAPDYRARAIIVFDGHEAETACRYDQIWLVGEGNLTRHSLDVLDRFQEEAQDRYDRPDPAVRAGHAEINRHFDDDARSPRHIRERMRTAKLDGVTVDSVRASASRLLREIQEERDRRGPAAG